MWLQVELLSWLAKEVSGWDEFAPKPRGAPEPEQVLLAISAAHKTIADYEWQHGAPQDSGWLGQTATAEGTPVEPPVRPFLLLLSATSLSRRLTCGRTYVCYEVVVAVRSM